MVLSIFINDGRMFQMAEIEHAHRSIGPDRGEHISSTTSAAKCNVVHFFIMSNQLGSNVATNRIRSTDRLARLNERDEKRTSNGRDAYLETPDCTCGIDARCTDEIRIDFVPIE